MDEYQRVRRKQKLILNITDQEGKLASKVQWLHETQKERQDTLVHKKLREKLQMLLEANAKPIHTMVYGALGQISPSTTVLPVHCTAFVHIRLLAFLPIQTHHSLATEPSHLLLYLPGKFLPHSFP